MSASGGSINSLGFNFKLINNYDDVCYHAHFFKSRLNINIPLLAEEGRRAAAG